MCRMSKTVVIGVTGSIAAYKAADLCSTLRAQKFISPLTFTTLTNNPVITDDNIGDYADRPEHLALGDARPEHLALGDAADAFLVAPATANIIGKMAHGIADDIVSTTYLSVTCPVLVAPAMNVRMWDHAAVQQNLEILRGRGVSVLDPDEGLLACGDHGKGRLASTDSILAAVREVLA